jgi:carbonic anhydrase
MNVTNRLTRRIAWLGALLLVAATHTPAEEAHHAQEAHHAHEWDYGQQLGPVHWGDLKPEFAQCKAGHHQSPIDVEKPQKADLPSLVFDYHPSPLRIVDNGHTIMVDYAPGSVLRVGDAEYALKQFHFHRPSEESIHGKRYEMSVHLVHANAAGQLAVVAILLENGREQPLLRELWKQLPTEKDKEQEHADVQIDVAQLLPSDHGYYTFEGSLTTPPCSESVTWFVLKQPVSVSQEEIARFSKIYRDNARPVQALNDRVVKETP